MKNDSGVVLAFFVVAMIYVLLAMALSGCSDLPPPKFPEAAYKLCWDHDGPTAYYEFEDSHAVVCSDGHSWVEHPELPSPPSADKTSLPMLPGYCVRVAPNGDFVDAGCSCDSTPDKDGNYHCGVYLK